MFYDESGILMGLFFLPPLRLSAPNGFTAPVACDITATQDCVTVHSVFTFVGMTGKLGTVTERLLV